MIFSICKNQLFIRGSSWILPCFKHLNFLPSYCLAIRYISAEKVDGYSFTTSYLINSCGFSPKAALAVPNIVNFQTPEKPDSVISFFKDHGFLETQIRTLIKRLPELLICNPEKILLPKFQFFYGRAVSRSKLASILSSNPSVLKCSLHNPIIPSFNYFKDLTHCDDDKVLVAYMQCNGVLANDFQSRIAPNVAVLRECGVPELNILSKLVEHPRVFVANPEKFKRTVEEVKKLGFNPLRKSFLTALQALVQLSKSTWERKVNVLKQWGWSNEEIALAFGKSLNFMMLSEHKIKAAMNFYVNTMGCKSSCIAKCPVLLSYSLHKRLIPRWLLLQVLLSKGLIKKEISIQVFFISNEKTFLCRFVTPYEDPYLLKLYEEKLGVSR
ncbi:hypothetical protein PTKIN_Ptkin16aG0091600 [Pterospermum kingtungense]